MKSKLPHLTCTAAIALMSLLMQPGKSAAAEVPMPKPGKSCSIQFSRDALGAAASLPIGPDVKIMNGAKTTLTCTFKGTHDDWVIVSDDSKELWIPKNMILFVAFD